MCVVGKFGLRMAFCRSAEGVDKITILVVGLARLTGTVVCTGDEKSSQVDK